VITLEKAIQNVSTLLNLDEPTVSSCIEESFVSLNKVQQYLALRSLCSQINLSDATFEKLDIGKKCGLLRYYILKHDVSGDQYLSYSTVLSYFKSSSFAEFIKEGLDSGFDTTADCLFPKKSFQSMKEYDYVWVLVASKWILRDYKKINPERIKSELATCYGLDGRARPYHHFMSMCSRSSLKEAVRYAPNIIKTGKQAPTWNNFKSIPIVEPLPCLSPLGFDFMAYQQYGYVDGVDNVSLWRNSE
jgi:hypothetical protein